MQAVLKCKCVGMQPIATIPRHSGSIDPLLRQIQGIPEQG